MECRTGVEYWDIKLNLVLTIITLVSRLTSWINVENSKLLVFVSMHILYPCLTVFHVSLFLMFLCISCIHVPLYVYFMYLSISIFYVSMLFHVLRYPQLIYPIISLSL